MQEIKLLRNMIVSSSRTQDFYNYVLYLHLKGIHFSKKCLVTRVLQTCANKNISLVKALCDKSYLQISIYLFNVQIMMVLLILYDIYYKILTMILYIWCSYF